MIFNKTLMILASCMLFAVSSLAQKVEEGSLIESNVSVGRLAAIIKKANSLEIDSCRLATYPGAEQLTVVGQKIAKRVQTAVSGPGRIVNTYLKDNRLARMAIFTNNPNDEANASESIRVYTRDSKILRISLVTFDISTGTYIPDMSLSCTDFWSSKLFNQ